MKFLFVKCLPPTSFDSYYAQFSRQRTASCEDVGFKKRVIICSALFFVLKLYSGKLLYDQN